MPVATPKQARARRTFDAILDATAALLLDGGIEGLNTNEVARQAGVNIATLYRYFDDKYDLVEGLLQRFTELQLDAIEREMERFDDPAERLREILRVQLKLNDEHPWIAAIQPALQASPNLRPIRDAHREYLGTMVLERLGSRGANTRGPFTLGRRRAAATRLLIEVFGAGLTTVADAPKSRRKAQLRELEILLNAYLDTMRPY